jgi:hypothetical protein
MNFKTKRYYFLPAKKTQRKGWLAVMFDKVAEFIKENKKVVLIPLIMLVVLTLIILALSALNPESDFTYLG